MSFSITNPLYPKPSVYQNATVSGRAITVTSTAAVSFVTTTAFNDITQVVTLDIQAANVYVTFDGTTPASGNGHILYNGEKYDWSRAAASAALFVATGTTDVTIYASEFQI